MSAITLDSASKRLKRVSTTRLAKSADDRVNLMRYAVGAKPLARGPRSWLTPAPPSLAVLSHDHHFAAKKVVGGAVTHDRHFATKLLLLSATTIPRYTQPAVLLWSWLTTTTLHQSDGTVIFGQKSRGRCDSILQLCIKTVVVSHDHHFLTKVTVISERRPHDTLDLAPAERSRVTTTTLSQSGGCESRQPLFG